MAKLLVGIDEVGRGCWAGPLVAAAVLLEKPIKGLTDSKLLSKKKRAELAKEIKLSAQYGLGWVDASEIDEVGLTQATTVAMTDALTSIQLHYDEVIIDGNFNYLAILPNVRTLIKADLLIACVSAASILAKVERDSYMAQMATQFPDYRFEQHVGYGTMLHRQLLLKHGVCSLHRHSYKPIKNLLISA